MTIDEYDNNANNKNDDDIEYVSKSQLKRESLAAQALGEELIKLNAGQLAKFDLPENLLEAIKLAQTITQRGGLKRQRQYIGKLMRDIDIDPIQQTFDEIKGVSAQAVAKQHKIEQWRERLINEGDPALQELLNVQPTLDIQRIRQLVRTAQKEIHSNKPPKAYRELFKYIREIIG